MPWRVDPHKEMVCQTDSPSSPIFIAHYLQDQIFILGGGEFLMPTVSPQVILAGDPQNACLFLSAGMDQSWLSYSND